MKNNIRKYIFIAKRISTFFSLVQTSTKEKKLILTENEKNSNICIVAVAVDSWKHMHHIHYKYTTRKYLSKIY